MVKFPGAFHHVGLACKSIDAEMAVLAAVGYAPEGPVYEDPIQKVAVRFLGGAGPRIELVEPRGPDSPVQGLLKRGTRYYHLAYEVPDLEAGIADLEKSGFRALAEPVPAVAFQMRRIVFLVSASFNLIELIEAVR